MEREILFVKNSGNASLVVPVIEKLGKFKIFMSDNGNPTLWYQIDQDGGVYGTKVIVKQISNNQKEDLCHAITLIKKWYNASTKKQAIEDFFPRIKAMVKRIYKGDYVLFSWLKGHDESHIVTTHSDLFRRAATELKSEGKTLKTDRFDTNGAEEILAIMS